MKNEEIKRLEAELHSADHQYEMAIARLQNAREDVDMAKDKMIHASRALESALLSIHDSRNEAI